ncbi:hypothetical protein Sjap_005155 [Stephania japonica]|uniref:Uncharacterized protein n=1 Tax=Stephania japonica TaxID=461633 RepID=A0AAP0PIG9_9MAGN
MLMHLPSRVLLIIELAGIFFIEIADMLAVWHGIKLVEEVGLLIIPIEDCK